MLIRYLLAPISCRCRIGDRMCNRYGIKFLTMETLIGRRFILRSTASFSLGRPMVTIGSQRSMSSQGLAHRPKFRLDSVSFSKTFVLPERTIDVSLKRMNANLSRNSWNTRLGSGRPKPTRDHPYGAHFGHKTRMRAGNLPALAS